MKVSIIIPIFNVEPYIERCLQSVVSQTCTCFECILVDDCGTDGSMPSAEQFIQNYSGEIHFRILRHENNCGLSAARNTGINAAIGDYIYFMDSDDAITPDCIETLLNIARKYPNADYVQGNIVTGSEQLMEGGIDPDVPEYVNDRNQLENIILCKSHRTAWNRLLKRSFLLSNSNNLFFPVGLVMEDHYWTYFVAKSAHAVAFTHKGTYYYYNNSGSIVNAKSSQHYIRNYSSYLTITDNIISDMLQRKDIQPCHRQYVGEAIVFCMIHLARLKSFSHWCKFWKATFRFAIKLKQKFTWPRFLLLICMLPPICLMTNYKGWRWRVRQYILTKV